MKFKDFRKIMKNYGKDYRYCGFIGEGGCRVYQEVTNGGETTVGEPFPASHFEEIVDFYEYECVNNKYFPACVMKSIVLKDANIFRMIAGGRGRYKYVYYTKNRCLVYYDEMRDKVYISCTNQKRITGTEIEDALREVNASITLIEKNRKR